MAFNKNFFHLQAHIGWLSFYISLEALLPEPSFLLFPFGLGFCILVAQLWFGDFPLPSFREFPSPLSCMNLLLPKIPVFLFINLYPVWVSISFNSFLKKWHSSYLESKGVQITCMKLLNTPLSFIISLTQSPPIFSNIWLWFWCLFQSPEGELFKFISSFIDPEFWPWPVLLSHIPNFHLLFVSISPISGLHLASSIMKGGVAVSYDYCY